MTINVNGSAATMDDAISFLTSKLEIIETEAYKVEYPLIDYSSVIPVDTSAPEYADSIGFEVVDHVAQAEWISSDSDEIPYADVKKRKESILVHEFALGYQYTIKEIMQSQAVGTPLDVQRASAAIEGHEEFLDKVAYLGDYKKGVPGFLTSASVPKATAAVGASTSYNWTTKTSEEILFDMNDGLATVFATTKNRHLPNRILLPSSMWSLIASKRMGDGSDETVLSYFMKTNLYKVRTGQDLMVIPNLRCEKFPEDVAQTTFAQRMVLYTADPRMVKMHIPMTSKFLDPQKKNLSVSVPGWARTAGTEVRMPLTMMYIKIQDAV